MNLNPCEIRRFNIKSFFYPATLSSALSLSLLGSRLLFGRGASVCNIDHRFVRSRCVRAFVCFALVWLFICLPLIQFLLFGPGDIGLLFKLLLKFRNVLKHSEGRSSFASLPSVILKYQRSHPHSVGGFPSLCRRT